jgi:alkane 1-monooxygenase
MEATTADSHHDHHRHEEVDVNPATWSDPKRYAWLLGIIIPLAPFMAWGSVALTGFAGLWLLGPLLVFVAFPILDVAVGVDASNPPDSVLKWLEQDRYYRWCTYVFIPIQYAGLILACWLWSNGDLTTLDSLGLAFTVGVVGGIAINTAHELGHKRASSERWLRPATGTSSSSTTVATTSASPPPRIPPAPASARASGPSCRARSPAACIRPGG